MDKTNFRRGHHQKKNKITDIRTMQITYTKIHFLFSNFSMFLRSYSFTMRIFSSEHFAIFAGPGLLPTTTQSVFFPIVDVKSR